MECVVEDSRACADVHDRNANTYTCNRASPIYAIIDISIRESIPITSVWRLRCVQIVWYCTLSSDRMKSFLFFGLMTDVGDNICRPMFRSFLGLCVCLEFCWKNKERRSSWINISEIYVHKKHVPVMWWMWSFGSGYWFYCVTQSMTK